MGFYVVVVVVVGRFQGSVKAIFHYALDLRFGNVYEQKVSKT